MVPGRAEVLLFARADLTYSKLQIYGTIFRDEDHFVYLHPSLECDQVSI